jgi:hypothetical protein
LVQDEGVPITPGESAFDERRFEVIRVPFPIGYRGHDLGWLLDSFCAPELALRPEFNEREDAGVACHLEQNLGFVMVWKVG